MKTESKQYQVYSIPVKLCSFDSKKWERGKPKKENFKIFDLDDIPIEIKHFSPDINLHWIEDKLPPIGEDPRGRIQGGDIDSKCERLYWWVESNKNVTFYIFRIMES